MRIHLSCRYQRHQTVLEIPCQIVSCYNIFVFLCSFLFDDFTVARTQSKLDNWHQRKSKCSYYENCKTYIGIYKSDFKALSLRNVCYLLIKITWLTHSSQLTQVYFSTTFFSACTLNAWCMRFLSQFIRVTITPFAAVQPTCGKKIHDLYRPIHKPQTYLKHCICVCVCVYLFCIETVSVWGIYFSWRSHICNFHSYRLEKNETTW